MKKAMGNLFQKPKNKAVLNFVCAYWTHPGSVFWPIGLPVGSLLQVAHGSSDPSSSQCQCLVEALQRIWWCPWRICLAYETRLVPLAAAGADGRAPEPEFGLTSHISLGKREQTKVIKWSNSRTSKKQGFFCTLCPIHQKDIHTWSISYIHHRGLNSLSHSGVSLQILKRRVDNSEMIHILHSIVFYINFI